MGLGAFQYRFLQLVLDGMLHRLKEGRVIIGANSLISKLSLGLDRCITCFLCWDSCCIRRSHAFVCPLPAELFLFFFVCGKLSRRLPKFFFIVFEARRSLEFKRLRFLPSLRAARSKTHHDRFWEYIHHGTPNHS